ncbi:hypothetical protein, partial [Vibrio parahaemolyticus]
TAQGTKTRFSQIQIKYENLAKNTSTLALNILLQVHFSSLATNAQLRGEQRLHPNLRHCAINTKFEVETKMPSVVNPS